MTRRRLLARSVCACLSIVCGLAMLPAYAASQGYPEAKAGNVPFFQDRERGWFWYEQAPPAEGLDKEPPPPAFPPKTIGDARRQLAALKEKAVMHPTEENLVAYIRLQNWVNDKSEQFADMWQRVLWQHPELDYSVGHPTEAQAILLHKQEQTAANRVRMAAIGRKYGLFFIFRSTCPYCHSEAPMLKRFAHSYGISVIPISQDGLGLPDYPNPRPDRGISAQLGVPSVPALLLVNPKRRDIIPVAYGLISEQALIRRIVTLTAHLEQPTNAGYPGGRR